MSVVVVLCLAFWLTAVMVAARQPGFSRVRSEKMPTGVHGGRHLAVGGRSVGPTRTALVAAATSDLQPAPASDAQVAGGAVPESAATAVPRPRTDRARAAEPANTAEPVAADERAAGIPGPRAGQDQQVPQD
jgi:hypothetical protein